MKRALSTRAFLLTLGFGLCGAVAALSSASCGGSPDVESKPYFDREIEPILQGSCSRQTTGCHIADARGNAVGNLDTTSFDMIDRRHDLLVTYGPYNAPGLLAKVGGPQSISVSTLDGPIQITTDIRHAAGAGIDVTSDGYATLRRWMDGGASRNNTGPAAPRLTPVGDCKVAVPTAPGFDPKADPGPGWDEFRTKVQPVLKRSCSAASCHGNDVADLSLTCGDSDEQMRWNAFIAAQFVGATGEGSEIVRRPLDPSRGGAFHEGGVVFGSTEEEGYKALLSWAKARGAPVLDKNDEGFKFFANRVQPTMVRKGCMFLGCHSPSMFHDLRLRGGSGGQFSLLATKRNYEMSKLMLSIESPDANVSRLIKKNLFSFDRDLDPKSVGTRHRGGPLLDDLGAGLDRPPTLEDCKTFDVDKGDLSKIPGYCVFARWHEIERNEAIKKGPTAGGIDKDPIRAIVYVSRPALVDVPQAFDTYRPGASLHLHAATMSATGAVAMGADSDKTSDCGLTAATADIRGPTVSWDGTTIAFAARTSASTPLAIYTMKADGTGCTKHAKISAHDAQGNGILIHDFDPTFAPDGRLIFASTRGAIGQSDTDYTGPSRTPGSLLPNSNLYVLEGDVIRQLTFLLGAELEPSFMADGRILFTTEKRAPGFYQLAARRMNLDGADYHPLFAQRKSLGFEQMTEVAELADRNFVGIFSDKGAKAHGGGLGVINRSLGPDQSYRDPADRFYLKSLSHPDPNSFGKPGSNGVYRSPSPLPSHALLASYAAGDPYAFDGTFELVAIDDNTGVRTPLVKVSGQSIVEAVAVYARYSHGIFTSRLDEPNGSSTVVAGKTDAEVRVLDLPMLASLLFENTREGRRLEPRAAALGILESLPPPNELTSLDGADPFIVSDEYGKVYAKRRRLGIVPAFDDASVAARIPGGIPIVLELWAKDGAAPLSTQKEEMQMIPGERGRMAFRRDLFDAQCGGCHGSISGKEIDVHLTVDVLTAASRVDAVRSPAFDLFKAPGARGAPFTGK